MFQTTSSYLWHEEILFYRGIFRIFYVRYSTLLHLLPFRFHCVGGCSDRTLDCVTNVCMDVTPFESVEWERSLNFSLCNLSRLYTMNTQLRIIPVIVSSHLAPPPTPHYTQPESILHRLSMELDLKVYLGSMCTEERDACASWRELEFGFKKDDRKQSMGLCQCISFVGLGPILWHCVLSQPWCQTGSNFEKRKIEKNSSEVHKYRAVKIGKNKF
jgi:hypothetical protein